jgi:hypothetical protein
MQNENRKLISSNEKKGEDKRGFNLIKVEMKLPFALDITSVYDSFVSISIANQYKHIQPLSLALSLPLN